MNREQKLTETPTGHRKGKSKETDICLKLSGSFPCRSGRVQLVVCRMVFSPTVTVTDSDCNKD